MPSTPRERFITLRRGLLVGSAALLGLSVITQISPSSADAVAWGDDEAAEDRRFDVGAAPRDFDFDDDAVSGEIMGGGKGRAESAPAPAPSSRSAPARRSTRRRAARPKPKASPSKSAAPEAPRADAASKDDKSGFDPQGQAGLLTAGSFDDNKNPGAFNKLMAEQKQNPAIANLARLVMGPRTELVITDGRGRPLADAQVRIRQQDGKSRLVTTRTDGRVIYSIPWDSLADRKSSLSAEVKAQGKTISASIPTGTRQKTIVVPGTSVKPATKLDVAIVVDVTGSMADELQFLKTEVRSIAKNIKTKFPRVDQRYALVAYRDTGDEFVTRVHDFERQMTSFERHLGAQSAGGGGDYPEAMDRALGDAKQLSWRGDGTARVLFLIADAPPHGKDIATTLKHADDLRSRGVAIYPVASSGVAGEAEFVMRTAAMFTGAQYLFLTDDSGVGNPHAEPHIPCYQVEALKHLMVRVTQSELAGRRLAPSRQQIIRTVGRPGADGTCLSASPWRQ